MVIYDGYKNVSQLGRYRSLTFDNSVTRLYTNAYFALTANLKLIDEIFPRELGYQQEHLRNREQTHEMTEVSMEDISENVPVKGDTLIPIVFKRYG